MHEWSLEADWPGELVLRHLIQDACVLFICAVTTCCFIYNEKQFARRKLDAILRDSSGAITAPEKRLDQIYLAILECSISSEFSANEKYDLNDKLKHKLASVVILISPLSISSLSRLLHFSREDIDRTLENLHAILHIPKDPTQTLCLHHSSSRGFLLGKDRCVDYGVDEKEAHQNSTTGCI